MKNENNNLKKSVKPIPEGLHSLTPFIVVNHATMFIDFLTKAFNAQTTFLMKGEEDKIMHATVQIGDSTIMIADTTENIAPSPCMLYLYVEDVDAVYQQALQAKGIAVRDPLNEFYGDRSGCIRDAWDNKWWIATHVEDVSLEETKRRAEQFAKHEA